MDDLNEFFKERPKVRKLIENNQKKCVFCDRKNCSGKMEDHCNYCGEYLKTKFALDPEYCSKSCYSADRRYFDET